MTRQITETTTKYVPRTVLVPVTVNVTKTIEETDIRSIQVPRIAYEEKVVDLPRQGYETRTIWALRPKVEMVEDVITQQVPSTTMTVKQAPLISYPTVGAPQPFQQFQPSFPGAYPGQVPFSSTFPRYAASAASFSESWICSAVNRNATTKLLRRRGVQPGSHRNQVGICKQGLDSTP